MSKPIEVVIADDNENLCNELEEYYEARSDIKIVGKAGDGKTALNLVEICKPDLLLLDIIMPILDGISVLYQLKEINSELKTIVITAFGQEHIVSRVADLGAAYYLIKPFEFSVLTKRIKDVFAAENEAICYRPKFDVDSLVRQRLDTFGISSNLKGYSYINTAVSLVLNNRRLIHSVTKHLYPEIGKQHGATGVQVERSIRHAIENTWLNGDPEMLEKYFGSSNPEMGRPSNASFISRLTEIISKERPFCS